jgi:hypothetical protein
MGRDQEQPQADVLIGVIRWQGDGDGAPRAGVAEVIRLAPYLLARRGRAAAPPASRG